MNNLSNNIYYVYALLNPLKPGEWYFNDFKFEYEPFYIGKGKNNRYKCHLYKKNLKHKNIKNSTIKKILSYNNNPISIIIYNNLSEIDAFKYEIEIIKHFGRKQINSGLLSNMTDGGDGASGTKMSPETKLKLKECGKNNGYKGKTRIEIFGKEKADEITKYHIDRISGKTYNEVYGEIIANTIKEKQSKSQKGKIKITDEGKKKLHDINIGKKLTEKTKEKISKSLIGNKRHLGKKHTNETKIKMSNSKKGSIPHNKYKILQYDLNMNFVCEWESSSNAAKALNFSQGNITAVINGKRKTSNGFIWCKK